MDCGSIHKYAKINHTFCFSNPGGGSRCFQRSIHWWRVVSGHESTRMEPVCVSFCFGLGHPVRLDGRISLDGVGFNEGAGTDSPGMVGHATNIEHRLVVGVFWLAPGWLGTRCDGHLATCGVDDNQDIQANPAGSLQFNVASSCLAFIFSRVKFCAMANKRRWIIVNFLSKAVGAASRRDSPQYRAVPQ